MVLHKLISLPILPIPAHHIATEDVGGQTSSLMSLISARPKMWILSADFSKCCSSKVFYRRPKHKRQKGELSIQDIPSLREVPPGCRPLPADCCQWLPKTFAVHSQCGVLPTSFMHRWVIQQPSNLHEGESQPQPVLWSDDLQIEEPLQNLPDLRGFGQHSVLPRRHLLAKGVPFCILCIFVPRSLSMKGVAAVWRHWAYVPGVSGVEQPCSNRWAWRRWGCWQKHRRQQWYIDSMRISGS